MTDFNALAAHFDPTIVSWRVGATTQDKTKGMALAYIDARDVLERLDEVCGPAGWQCEYVPMPDHTTCCRIGIKVGDEWIWKANGGSNVAESDKADAQEMAAKGGYSDAFKRAAVQWGIGRYLYAVQSPWVALVARGKSYAIAEGEESKLRGILARMAASSAPPPSNPAREKVRTQLKASVDDEKRFNDMLLYIDKLAAPEKYSQLMNSGNWSAFTDWCPADKWPTIQEHLEMARTRLGVKSDNALAMAG